ncbi:MAG: hypothetical protein A2Z73_05700 [Deltaproteobacteria bacterium RBG_13_60_28]|nr:MAG: hypothetical protein A2Z73_05700 [Deltaproteobacteria bacterium RBG_13_60_28]
MNENQPLPKLELTDADIYEAMKAVPGYLDITPGDFKEVYQLAFKQALQRLRGSVPARDIMTKEVIAVYRDTPLAEVAERMGRGGISGVPVLDADQKVVGVISEKDFLMHMGLEKSQNFMVLVANCLKTKKCLALPIRAQIAEGVMSAPAVTVREETPLAEVAQILTAHSINRAPVTDAQGRMVGIISRGDIVRATTHRTE